MRQVKKSAKVFEQILTVSIVCLLLYSITDADSMPDSLSFHPKRNAAIQALTQDYALWATNHYLLKQEWSEISLQTLKDNIETGWVWDTDGFNVNQFGHPIQGAMVFSAGRAQGLSYLQSVPYLMLSSFVWEMSFENEPPSINDIVTTTLSGTAFGEIIHRISEITLGSNAVISPWRQWLTGVINPTGYGVNRLLFGPKIHHNYNTEIPPVLSGISVGGIPSEKFGEQNNFFPEQFIRFHIVYGNPFTNKAKFKPFDNFSFISILNIGGNDPVAEIYASGMVKKLKTKKFTNSTSVLGVFHNYDFMNQDDYKVSVSSFGLGYLQNINLSSNIQILIHSSLSSILMGSAGDTEDKYDNDDMRDYHSGPGFSGKIMLKTSVKNLGEMYVRLNRYFIYTMDNTNIEGYENINLLNAGVQVKIFGSIALGGEYIMATRNFSNRGLTFEFEQNNNTARIYLVYNFLDTLFNT